VQGRENMIKEMTRSLPGWSCIEWMLTLNWSSDTTIWFSATLFTQFWTSSLNGQPTTTNTFSQSMYIARCKRRFLTSRIPGHVSENWFWRTEDWSLIHAHVSVYDLTTPPRHACEWWVAGIDWQHHIRLLCGVLKLEKVLLGI